MSTFKEAFELEKVGPSTFKGIYPLKKPIPEARGAYGGNIAGQAVLVGMRTVPDGFSPNSFHSLFVKGVLDQIPMVWEVEENSNGRNFCSRTIRGIQDGKVRYIVEISFTKNNSLKQAEINHQNYLNKKVQQAAERSGKEVDDEDDDELDDLVQKPFYFLTPYPEWLKEATEDDLIRKEDTPLFLDHKFPRQFVSLKGTEYEEEIAPSERRMSYFGRIGDGTTKLESPDLQYVAVAVISDAVFLAELARVFRVRKENLKPYFSVSLDHHMYFHDTDFDCTDWIGFAFRAVRFVNNRVLLEAEMYNSDGQHFATIFQEGLVHLNGLLDSKL
ncbi:CIC11C00000005703 [Sungouiella intermedia]|uniref:CIC11C00000005703 n=1 Tax=Sungouiella intermedia TaxID=45354 RepID=A0A1L0CUF8_9ASCO|nr:CIC11C00000005703 [[Candida] intermedia]